MLLLLLADVVVGGCGRSEIVQSERRWGSKGLRVRSKEANEVLSFEDERASFALTWEHVQDLACDTTAAWSRGREH